MRGAAWLAVAAAVPAWASHPLLTEDTEVLGKGVRELELHGERLRDRESGVTKRGTEGVAKLGYGFADKADVEIELPYVREVTDGEALEGRGDATLAVKWRFFEADRLSFVFKPELLLPTGRDELGIGTGRARWGANLAGAYELGRWELLAHAGYLENRNRAGERRSLWHASAAVRYSLTDKLKVLADYARETEPDPGAGSQVRELVIGATYALSERIDLGLGFKKGLNDPADDRALLAGVKLRW